MVFRFHPFLWVGGDQGSAFLKERRKFVSVRMGKDGWGQRCNKRSRFFLLFIDFQILIDRRAHYVRTSPVIKVLRSFFKSDPPVILRPQACGALFGSFSRASSFERKNAWLPLTFYKSKSASLSIGFVFFVQTKI